jgi:hypothetical protein
LSSKSTVQKQATRESIARTISNTLAVETLAQAYGKRKRLYIIKASLPYNNGDRKKATPVVPLSIPVWKTTPANPFQNTLVSYLNPDRRLSLLLSSL